jgi:hypothetical protein
MQITPQGQGPLLLALHAPDYTVAQLEAMGETPTVDSNGRAGMSYSETSGTIGISAGALTSSDLALIGNATGALQIGTGPDGVYISIGSSGAPTSAQSLNAALAQMRAGNENPKITPSEMLSMANSQAQFDSATSFANVIASIRQSIGPNQAITPSMIISAVKQANASSETIPQYYLTNAIGYLNGIRTSS